MRVSDTAEKKGWRLTPFVADANETRDDPRIDAAIRRLDEERQQERRASQPAPPRQAPQRQASSGNLARKMQIIERTAASGAQTGQLRRLLRAK